MSTIYGDRVARKRKKLKGRATSGSFLLLHHAMMRSREFGLLSAWGVKLLCELGMQFSGYNNGDLSAAYSVLRKRGWNSTGTLNKAIKELKAGGWIVTTRQGGRNRCSLFAVTWLPIDDCDGKHDYPPEKVAGNDWKKTAVPR